MEALQRSEEKRIAQEQERLAQEQERLAQEEAIALQEAEVVYLPHQVNACTQTDMTADEITALEADYQQRLLESCQVRARKGFPDEEDLKSDEKLLRFYTGLTSFTVLMSVFNLVAAGIPESPISKLTQFESFTLTLMKLRLNVANFDLAFRFGVCATTVGRIFSKWIDAMNVRLSFLVLWPDRESLHKTMPFCFRINYGLKVTSIIDCFELFIEKPSNLLAKSCTWSQYKHYNTAKYLISIAPQGLISFISNGYGGRVSDKQIVETSGYLLNLSPGDVILADRGFDVRDSFGIHGATLDIPTFTRGHDQLPAEDVEATRKLANVRIHVERIIGAVRQRFQILSATGVLPKEMSEKKTNETIMLDAVVCVCCALHNVCEGIVPFN